MTKPPFTGLDAAAFAVYTPEKWSSMVHNLPRMRNKELLAALCEHATAGLCDQLGQTARCASDEIPNVVNHRRVDYQGVFWIRDAATRTQLASFLEKTPLDQKMTFNLAPQDKHVALAVIIQRTGLWVGLRLAAGAAVDRHNLQKKMLLSWERPRLLECLHELPAETQVGFAAAAAPLEEAAQQVDDAKLALLAPALASDERPFWVGSSLSVDEVVQAGAQLVDGLSRRLAALLPLYRYIAWSRDNDLIDAGKQIQEEKARKRQQATAFRKGERVRVLRGPFAGKVGQVLGMESKQVRLMLGIMAVLVPGEDLAPGK